MSEQQVYPYRRVIIGFVICPALVSVFMVLAGILKSIYFQKFSITSWKIFVEYPALMLLVSAVALMFYGVPALLLALFYAAIRLYKSLSAYILVFLVGGLGAHLWGAFINNLNVHRTQDFPGLPGLGEHGLFLLAATTSLVMAYLVLPKRSPSSDQ